jgi:hypothetical protein
MIGRDAGTRGSARGSVMSSISIKGIVVGNLFSIATSLMTGIALLAMLAAPYEADGFIRAAQTMSTGFGLIAGFALSGVIGLTAGFLAARVAGKGELLNGTLSSVLYVAYRIVCWPDGAGFPAVVDIAAAPLLGLLGGYLRLRQGRRAP